MRNPNSTEIRRLAEAQRKVQRAQLAVARAQAEQQAAALEYDQLLVDVQEACHVPPGAGVDLGKKCWLAPPAPQGAQALEMDAEAQTEAVE